MDVPPGDHVTLQLPLQVVVVPPQDLVGDVEAGVVVKLAPGEVEVPIEIASLRQPEGGRKRCGQPPRLEKSCNVEDCSIEHDLRLVSFLDGQGISQVGPFVARGREIIGAWEKLPMPVIAALDGVRPS